MNVIPIPQPWRSRAIVIGESAVPLSWFSEEELRAAESFRLPRRRDEFLLSRAAAKALAVEAGLAADVAACRIEQRRIGSRFLSLSHSAPYAAAAIDTAPVGIDVQVVRPLSEQAAHLFLTAAETEVMRACALSDRLIHFWSAKEALWKRLGGSIETLKRVPLSVPRISAEGLRFDEVETVRVGDLVVALTLPTS
ncbi:MAG TPA: 4'-phosphopantetheinyl transferase superfamily protein [Thermoanaerobaculia bacterium]|nr:4'-phosphopantetheinyl transferase superfamily protein [Thermoanaerobaculia bacterium]